MPDGYSARLAALDAAAGRLRGAADGLGKAPSPPEPPPLGVATAAVADLVARLGKQTGIAVGGLGAASDAVAKSRKTYRASDVFARERLPRPR
ncbi:hypothetical protein EV193_106213 [Herbihabitans rhizosphaerae]|uniref:Uncharacterized protein n=1 Tax=Herbihabitans rhizosphaerae TaxID=1872711 RepID=A0A4Q7KK47_9PSEU|nr:hypothetical protein [Herbihabitans rhizosphaerae]RZS36978.1 hypothetical protein EV193_106213 [Herbihabitans rhizosphaerae]